VARPLQESIRSKRTGASKKAAPAANPRRQRLWRDIALILVTPFLFYLLASLVTFSPADPGWSHSGSITAPLHNVGGRVGAWLADVLLYLTGYVAFLLPVVLGGVAWIALFGMDSDGKPGNRRVFLQFGPGDGYPDGMTVDSEGCLWIAFWDGWCVRRYSPSGEWMETIDMPVARPTSCVFGGRDLEQLYITSASIGLDDEAKQMQPNAGGLFIVVPGVQGIADVPFAG